MHRAVPNSYLEICEEDFCYELKVKIHMIIDGSFVIFEPPKDLNHGLCFKVPKFSRNKSI